MTVYVMTHAYMIHLYMTHLYMIHLYGVYVVSNMLKTTHLCDMQATVNMYIVHVHMYCSVNTV